MTMNEDAKFEEWMKAVDDVLENKVGLSSSCMRDRLWYDSYEAGETPEEAIQELCGNPDNVVSFMERELYG
tara:strand:+ start:106 stop:318 length:213 start_codon:yes stop_codon:yes gene_type:complete